MRSVMSTIGTASSGDRRHTARKNADRELSARTGMPYAAALRHVTGTEGPWQPRHRWILTFPVKSMCRTFPRAFDPPAKSERDHRHTGVIRADGCLSARAAA
jgi:hypothetical protein